MTAKPLVIAHRGSSAAIAEHTLGAYRAALADGADGLECDVRLTLDGHLVCLHDPNVDRTSDGTGAVARMTLSQLRRLDFGSWHPNGAPAMVLTLDELVAEALGAGRPVRLLIETKHPNRFGKAVEHRLRSVLRRHRLCGPDRRGEVQVSVMSFSPMAVRRARDLMPDLATVQLFEVVPPGLPLRRLPFGSRIVGPGLELIRHRPEIILQMRAFGNQVYVWTVNTERDVLLLTELGVDAIITDRPRMVLDVLGR